MPQPATSKRAPWRDRERVVRWSRRLWPSLTGLSVVLFATALVTREFLPAVAGLTLGYPAAISGLIATNRGAEAPLTAGDGRLPAAVFSVLALAVVAVVTGGDRETVAAYASAVTGLHLAGEGLRRACGRVGAEEPLSVAANLSPDVDLSRFLWRARAGRVAGSYAVTALEVPLLLVVWAAGGGGAVTAAAIVLLVVALAVVVAATVWARRFARSGRVERHEAALVRALDDFGPELVFCVTTGGAGAYMANQWIGPVDALERRVLVVARSRGAARDLHSTRWPVVVAPSHRAVEQVFVPSVLVALYPSNGEANLHLLQEPGVRHVFLNHGDSDKLSSASPVSRVYDEVWVAGQAAVDRYEAAGLLVSRDRFRTIGRPQAEAVERGAAPDPPRVLYAPTFEGFVEKANYSSLETMGEALVAAILERHPDVGVIFRPHPRTGRFRPGMAAAREAVNRMLRDAGEASPHVVADDEPSVPLTEHLRLAHVLVTDISSVSTDFLPTGRPVVVTNPLGLDPDEFTALFPWQSAFYVAGPEPADVLDAYALAVGPDPKRGERASMEAYLVGSPPGGPTAAFAAAVDEACALAAEARDATPPPFSLAGRSGRSGGSGPAASSEAAPPVVSDV